MLQVFLFPASDLHLPLPHWLSSRGLDTDAVSSKDLPPLPSTTVGSISKAFIWGCSRSKAAQLCVFILGMQYLYLGVLKHVFGCGCVLSILVTTLILFSAMRLVRVFPDSALPTTQECFTLAQIFSSCFSSGPVPPPSRTFTTRILFQLCTSPTTASPPRGVAWRVLMLFSTLDLPLIPHSHKTHKA